MPARLNARDEVLRIVGRLQNTAGTIVRGVQRAVPPAVGAAIGQVPQPRVFRPAVQSAAVGVITPQRVRQIPQQIPRMAQAVARPAFNTIRSASLGSAPYRTMGSISGAAGPQVTNFVRSSIYNPQTRQLFPKAQVGLRNANQAFKQQFELGNQYGRGQISKNDYIAKSRDFNTNLVMSVSGGGPSSTRVFKRAQIEMGKSILKNKEVRRILGEFAELAETKPQALRKDLGKAGEYIHSLGTTVFGDEAANLTNKQLKNAFDALMEQSAKSNIKPRFTIGLGSRSIREGKPKPQNLTQRSSTGTKIPGAILPQQTKQVPLGETSLKQGGQGIRLSKSSASQANLTDQARKSQIEQIVYNSELDPRIKDAAIKQNQKLLEKQAKQEFRAAQQIELRQKLASEREAVKSITGAIKTGTRSPAAREVESLRDINGTQAGFRDVYRNFKHVYGKQFEDVKRNVLDPLFVDSKRKYLQDQEQWTNIISRHVEGKLGVRKGSKESALVQKFGEGEIDLPTLQKQAPKKWQNIVEADKFFRQTYDRMLDEVNAVRKQIYPNDPEKIIPKRQDYYRHFQELAEGVQGLINIFETPAGISSKLAGVSQYAKPKSKFLSFAQQRLGGATQVDAVGGFLDYLKSYAYAKNIDPNIPRFRNLAAELAEQTAEGTNKGKLNTFIEYLTDFSDDLAGKTNPLDRGIQKYIPGGRRTFRVINWLNSRVKANTIVGNIASSIAQGGNVPQGIASAGPVAATQGLKRSLASIFTRNGPMENSVFIKERYFNVYDKFDRGILNNTKKFARWMTVVLDEVGTKYIWNAHYEKALREKIPDAVNYADDVTKSLVAGRGIGEVPIAQKAKTFQLVAPFQLEVGNLWWVMKDMVDEKAFGKLATLFVASYVYNRGAEAIRGSDVTFDPIQAVIEGAQTLDEENYSKKGFAMATGRLGGEVLSNIPFGQSVAATYPEYGFKVGDTQAPTRKELFGKGDPTRFGSGLLVAKGLQDPLYKVIPGYGGQQIKRMVEGLTAYGKGYSESATGRVQYPIEKTGANLLRTATFGKSSTPEARKYFKTDKGPLGDVQSFRFKQGDTGEAYKREALEAFMKGNKEKAREIQKKYKVNLTKKEVKTEVRDKAFEYYFKGDISRARELIKNTGVTITNKEAKSKAKTEAIKRFRAGDRAGARELQQKFKFSVTKKEVMGE